MADAVIPAARVLDPTDTGGWFTLWHQPASEFHGCSPVFGCRIGIITGSTPLRELMRVANEKAERLNENRDHVSSWQTRDVGHPNPMKHQYGGAIRVRQGMILSFSGLAEHFDEMGMLLIAEALKLITQERIAEIVAISDNQHFLAYQKAMVALRRDI